MANRFNYQSLALVVNRDAKLKVELLAPIQATHDQLLANAEFIADGDHRDGARVILLTGVPAVLRQNRASRSVEQKGPSVLSPGCEPTGARIELYLER
jgi:hypothetical protein